MPSPASHPPNTDVITTEMPVAVALDSDVCFIPDDEEVVVAAFVEKEEK